MPHGGQHNPEFITNLLQLLSEAADDGDPSAQTMFEGIMEGLRRSISGDIAPFNTPPLGIPDEAPPGSPRASIADAFAQFPAEAMQLLRQHGASLQQLGQNTGQFFEDRGWGNGGLGNPNAPGMQPPPPPPPTPQTNPNIQSLINTLVQQQSPPQSGIQGPPQSASSRMSGIARHFQALKNAGKTRRTLPSPSRSGIQGPPT